MAQIFDPAIFDEAVFEAAAGGAWSSGELDTFWARFMEECGNMAEYLERTDPPRPTFYCTKAHGPDRDHAGDAGYPQGRYDLHPRGLSRSAGRPSAD